MNLKVQAKKDIKIITGSSGEWVDEIKLTSPSGIVAHITGLHTKHHLGVDSDGVQINSKNSHISFSEENIQNYPVRNQNGEVSLKNHRVSVKDSTGILKEYVIQEWFPDETIGLIVCILGDYGTN